MAQFAILHRIWNFLLRSQWWMYLLILFFFLRVPQYIFHPLGFNWAYIIDQFGLVAIAGYLGWRWIIRNTRFRLGWPLVATIVIVLLAVHSLSFERAFFYDEFSNILEPLFSINYSSSDYQSMRIAHAGFIHWREIYAWAPFTLLYQLFSVTHPLSIWAFSIAGVFSLAAAALAAAWLAGILSRSRVAAAIAGLLVGISPNTFGALPWLSNILGDNLGIILTCFTVGTWIIARQRKDRSGILLALLLLAATLKGGGAVRTISVGGLLVLSDTVLFQSVAWRRKLVDWSWVGIITAGFFILNLASSVPLEVGQKITLPLVQLAALAEATTKAFIPPTLLGGLLAGLHTSNDQVTWVIWLGLGIFILGTLVALLAARLTVRGRIFAWGWVWFYLTIWYVPFFAVGFSTDINQISDRLDPLFGGYKYAYLPLVGLYAALAIILGSWLNGLRSTTAAALPRRLLGALGILLVTGLLGFRAAEFLTLEQRWRLGRSIPDRAVYQTLLRAAPAKKMSPKLPSALLIVDGPHNPITSTNTAAYLAALYPPGALQSFEDPLTFYNQRKEQEIPPERVYAIGWDSGAQKMLDLTPSVRRWLENPQEVEWTTTDFSGWQSNTAKEGAFFAPQFELRGTKHLAREPLLVSPELQVPLPAVMRVELEVTLKEIPAERKPKEGVLKERASLELNLPGTLLLPQEFWSAAMQEWYRKFFEGFLAAQTPTSPVFLSREEMDRQSPSFVIAPSCNANHRKLQSQALVSDQRLFSDELHYQKKSLESPVRQGTITLSTTLPCRGAQLTRIVILGPATSYFTLNRLTISFPRP